MRDIGWAIEQMRGGERVQRAGWNGKGMWLALRRPEDGLVDMDHSYVYMSDVAGKLFPWNPNQLDMLAMDWQLWSRGP